VQASRAPASHGKAAATPSPLLDREQYWDGAPIASVRRPPSTRPPTGERATRHASLARRQGPASGQPLPPAWWPSGYGIVIVPLMETTWTLPAVVLTPVLSPVAPAKTPLLALGSTVQLSSTRNACPPSPSGQRTPLKETTSVPPPLGRPATRAPSPPRRNPDAAATPRRPARPALAAQLNLGPHKRGGPSTHQAPARRRAVRHTAAGPS
jgi:hypothetical protein